MSRIVLKDKRGNPVEYTNVDKLVVKDNEGSPVEYIQLAPYAVSSEYNVILNSSKMSESDYNLFDNSINTIVVARIKINNTTLNYVNVEGSSSSAEISKVFAPRLSPGSAIPDSHRMAVSKSGSHLFTQCILRYNGTNYNGKNFTVQYWFYSVESIL